MIQVRLRKHYRPRPDSAAFLLDIDFRTGGAVTVLFGPSGSGKTLTLDCIAGFVRPEDGRVMVDEDILFDGDTGVHLPPQDRRCGYVFQNYALFPHMNLRDNLTFPIQDMARLERHRRVNEMLERFRLTDVAGRKPHELSGGQKQRGSIARALLVAPRLLLLDEPARGLDPALRLELYEVLRSVREEFGTPILLVTHDLEECFELGDRMIILRDGKLVQQGSPQEVFDKPASIEIARLLGIYNLLPVEIRTLDPGRNTSRVVWEEWELAGPYFPGKFKGDKAWLCLRPQELKATVRGNIRPGPNQVPVQLVRVSNTPGAVRLEFDRGVAAEVPRIEFERSKHIKDWMVEFPVEGLRAL